MIELGSRRELFVDQFLVETLQGLSLKLHEPRPAPPARHPVAGGYNTIVSDGDLFRRYYRRSLGPTHGGHDGNPGEITCYAESSDGIDWTEPDLGLVEIDGSRVNNAILAHDPPWSHNFCPFLDTRPGVPEEQRFKALAGTHQGDPGRPANAPPLDPAHSGLTAFVSADGKAWRKLRPHAVITSELYAFDSQNVAFWSKHEGTYVCYFRTWMPDGRRFTAVRLRSISRTTSDDFIHWTPAVALDPNLPGEHLYTSQTHPYFRAPHIYVALPTRFLPDRGSSTDIMFMTSRGGNSFDRTFTEAFVRPGLDPARWGNRANYAALGVIPTSETEMAIYVHNDRYVLRTDGFSSLHAGAERGEMTTRPFAFTGSELRMNYSTAAAGTIRAELLEEGGRPIPGFGIEDCAGFVGDEIEGVMKWRGERSVGSLAGKIVRLRLEMMEADVFSFRFV